MLSWTGLWQEMRLGLIEAQKALLQASASKQKNPGYFVFRKK
jgi:hypothetical protein